MLLTARGLTRTLGLRKVIDSLDVSIDASERIGLIGRNGCGKSTLARLLAGVDRPDEGEVVVRGGTAVAYLAQIPDLPDGVSARAAVIGGMPQWAEAFERHALWSERLAAGVGDEEVALAEQSRAAEEVERLGGWSRDHEADELLGHLGVGDGRRLASTLSGGERRRVALARLLIARPDLAILDEPTNHLDIEAIAWLEQWLIERHSGALLLVTHDRQLLDRVVNRTLELDSGKLYSYEGGWEAFLQGKAERQAHEDRVAANRRNFLRRELEWLSRRPKARTTKQRARIDRVEAVRDTLGPTRTGDVTLDIRSVRAGRTILEAQSLVVGIPAGVDHSGAETPARPLLRDLDLRLSEGEIIGIVGPNGCGKTTLLRTLTGQIPPLAGTLVLGKNTKIAYLDQLRADLDPDATVAKSIVDDRVHVEVDGKQMDARGYLERFLFSGADLEKRVRELSGGERARVALARLLGSPANLVILDEPTNDLDVSTLSALESALLDFPGTVLLVTHDRWFLDRVATSLLVIGSERATLHQGGWSDLEDRREREREAARQAAAAQSRPTRTSASRESGTKAPATGLSRAERLELDGLLDVVASAEDQLATLEAALSSAEFFALDHTEQRARIDAVGRARAEVERLTARWEALEAVRERTSGK